jgi:hypothetical protein
MKITGRIAEALLKESEHDAIWLVVNAGKIAAETAAKSHSLEFSPIPGASAGETQGIVPDTPAARLAIKEWERESRGGNARVSLLRWWVEK